MIETLKKQKKNYEILQNIKIKRKTKKIRENK